MRLSRKITPLTDHERIVASAGPINGPKDLGKAIDLVVEELATGFCHCGFTRRSAKATIQNEEVPHLMAYLEAGGREATLDIVFDERQIGVRPSAGLPNLDRLPAKIQRRIITAPTPRHMSDTDFLKLSSL